MGMETLRCHSPKMVHKELEMFFIAYNAIRCLMAEAAETHAVAIDRLSFKGTVDSVRQFSAAIAQARSCKKQNQLMARLLESLRKIKSRSGLAAANRAPSSAAPSLTKN